jgi:hypothetical protein
MRNAYKILFGKPEMKRPLGGTGARLLMRGHRMVLSLQTPDFQQ